MQTLRLPNPIRALAGGTLAIALCASGLHAQQGAGALVVTVTSQESGRPVMGARVSVVGTSIAAPTDAAGKLRVAGVPSGVLTVEVRRLGYATRLKLVRLEPGQTAPVDFMLEVEAIPVAAIEVEARRRDRDWGAEYLERSGFDRRRRTGAGQFLTRADIEKRRPMFLSDALRQIAGIRFQPQRVRGGSYVTMSRTGTRFCPVQYFVDGTLIGPGYNIDEIRADDVQGVEVYRGASEVPPEFNRRTAACGVIAVWTRPQ